MGAERAVTTSPGLLHRLARRPLWQHAFAVLVVLTALIPVIGTRGQFHDDEGAAKLQAAMLDAGDGWLRPYQFPEYDPGYVRIPIFGAEPRVDGYAPYGKHPAYPLLLVPFDAVAGAGGLLFASALGAALAALCGGLIGERLRRGSGVVALWVTAFGSPIFFDGLIVEAHAIAAALAGGAVLAVLAFLERPRWVPAVAAVAALVAAGLLRTEALLFAVALGAAVVLVALRRRRAVVAVAGTAFAAVGFAVRVGEPRLTAAVLPSTNLRITEHLHATGSFVADRFFGAVTTLVQGGYDWVSLGFTLSFLAAVLLASTALITRRRPADSHGIAVFAVAAAAVFVLRAIAAPSGAIPGLLLACPIVLVALVVLRRDVFRGDPRAVVGLTVALFAAAVLATQYAYAGGTEWGWRYFALALPAAVPLAIAVVWPVVERLDRRARSAVVGATAVACLALVSVGVSTLVSDHRESSDQAAMVVRALQAGVAGPPGDAVVITTYPPIGRYARRDLDAGKFAIVNYADLATVMPLFVAHGVDRLLVVTNNTARDVPALRASYGEVTEIDQRGGVALFLVATPG